MKTEIVRIKEIRDEEVIFTNGYGFRSNHYSDCCEWHYLDCSDLWLCNVGSHTGEPIRILEQEFEFHRQFGMEFERVEGEGIKIFDTEGNAYFIPGRGNNNGYYSDNLSLEFFDEQGNVIVTYDITKCQNWEAY